MLTVPVSDDDHAQGNKNAAITLVEYGDFQCPFCGHAYPIIKEAEQYFGSSLRFVFRNFPITEVHPMAYPAAQIAEFAASQGKFWQMHDQIFENQTNLSVELLLQLTESLGLSMETAKDVLRNNTFDQKIQKDFMGGVRSGVNGTPTLYINDQRYPGAVEDLITVITEIQKKAI